MQRNRTLAYLLFSLFLLLASCGISPAPGFSRLADGGKFAELEQKSAKALSKRIEAETLYYRAVALEGLARHDEAFHLLSLYFAMASAKDANLVVAHRLMCRVATEAKEPEKVLSSARWLDSLSLLEREQVELYYQALLMTGNVDEATTIFTRFLKDTIEPVAYARMLLASEAEEKKVVEAFSFLHPLEQLTLIQSSASDTVSPERAKFLLSLAIPLEAAITDSSYTVQIYGLLADLYGYADLRVQARKYSTLAQNL